MSSNAVAALVAALALAASGCTRIDGTRPTAADNADPMLAIEASRREDRRQEAERENDSASAQRLAESEPSAATGDRAQRTPSAVAGNGQAASKSFDDLKFDIELEDPYDRSLLTVDIEALNGQRIRLPGYMLPTAYSRNIREFVLVRDDQECCFGPRAALYDCVFVRMRRGESATYTVRPVTVEGTFRIKSIGSPGRRPLAIFQLHDTTVLQ